MRILLKVLIYFYGNYSVHFESMSIYSLQILNMSLPQKYNLLPTTFIEIISQLPEVAED